MFLLVGRRDVSELAVNIQRQRGADQCQNTYLLLWRTRCFSRPLLVSKSYPFILVSCSFHHRHPLFSLCKAPEEHMARFHPQGPPGNGQTLWDMASGLHVRHGSVVKLGHRSAPGPADTELFQPVHCSLYRDPQETLNPLHTTPLRHRPQPH